MIILLDQKHYNYAIRLCEDSDTNVFVSTDRPYWFSETKFLSDINYRVFVVGDKAEEKLDDKGIYYIHVEYKAKENFVNFTKRMEKMIKDRENLLDMSSSTHNLLFALTYDYKRGTYKTENVFTIEHDLTEDDYVVNLNITDDMDVEEQIKALDTIDKELNKWLTDRGLGPVGYKVEMNNDFYTDINFSYGKTLQEVIGKFHMFKAILKASR